MQRSSPIGDVIIELTEIDSTNNYAMRLLNEGMAEHGLVIRTDFQTHGRGQLGNIWLSEESKNLLFSIVLDTTSMPIDYQFMLNAMATVSIAHFMMDEFHIPDICIKWPNDIYAGGKKISGILIENQLRGNTWTNSIVGIGMNINQTAFPDLVRATSVQRINQKTYKLNHTLKRFLAAFNQSFMTMIADYDLYFRLYNNLLYKQGEWMDFTRNHELYQGKVIGVNTVGLLQLEVNGKIRKYKHKDIEILIS
jgi:BirA family biotin operon repressor/biotin-[acetyl-CoA-carboxylase] ligase